MFVVRMTGKRIRRLHIGDSEVAITGRGRTLFKDHSTVKPSDVGDGVAASRAEQMVGVAFDGVLWLESPHGFRARAGRWRSSSTWDT